MTRMLGRVTRVTVDSYNILYSGRKNSRPIVVQLAKGDVLRFRELGRREWFDLPVEVAFRAAVRRKAFIEKVRDKVPSSKTQPNK